MRRRRRRPRRVYTVQRTDGRSDSDKRRLVWERVWRGHIRRGGLASENAYT